MPHPPPNADPTQGGVFPLGCGICRSEKLEILQNRAVQQVVTAENMPKPHFQRFNYDIDSAYGDEYGPEKEEEDDPNKAQIIRPDVEIEMPDFIAQAEELLEAELEAERERIRLLNLTPVNFLNPRQAKKKEKAEKRRQQRMLQDYNLPAWVLNPLDEVDYEAEADKLILERKAYQDKIEAQRLKALRDVEEERARELAIAMEKAKQKTNEMQRKALKVICGLAPKRARAPMRRRR